MKISILTPSYCPGKYLKSCVVSVQSQKLDCVSGLEIEHYIQDGTPEGSESAKIICEELNVGYDYSFPLIINQEPDLGMYDALNKIYELSDGDIIGHLNADEQYLPGTLSLVAKFFIDNPNVDVLWGGVILTDKNGDYLSSRMPVKPKLLHTKVCHLCNLTASMFFRRRITESIGHYYNESFRASGDSDLVCRMISEGSVLDVIPEYFSIFVMDGNNLSISETARRENKIISETAPLLARKASMLLSAYHKIEKFMCGCYFLKRFKYQFITTSCKFKEVIVNKPTYKWPSVTHYRDCD